jgi:hypothetical protein
MGEKDKDREKEYSPNPDFNRPKPRETPAEQMAADREWCIANGTPEMFYSWYPWARPPERERHGGRGGRGGR